MIQGLHWQSGMAIRCHVARAVEGSVLLRMPPPLENCSAVS